MLFIVTPILAILDGDELVPISGVLAIFGSLLFLLISLIILPRSPKRDQTEQPRHETSYRQSELSMPRTYGELPVGDPTSVADFVPPVAGSWQAPETGDLARPASVTEDTTKLLKKELDK